MKKLKNVLAGLLVVPVVAFGAGFVTVADVAAQGNANVNKALQDTGQTGSASVDPANIISTVVGWLLFFVGALSVIMLIWGGIKYATSAGDANKVTSAKNTIMYAIIGLIVALFAYAIVYFVTNNLVTGTGLGGPGA